jgi:hypothetical protein
MKKLELITPSLVCGLFLLAGVLPSALADAELEILVGSTEVYDSGDLASASSYGTYSYSSGTTSFSVFYGWNNESPGSTGHLMTLNGTDVISSVPVTFELSENNNIVEDHCWSQATVGFDEQYVGSVSTYFSANNALLAPTELLFTVPLSDTRENEGITSAGGSFDASGLYSLTQVLTLTGNPGPDDFIDIETFVPDDEVTLSMLGMTSFGLFAIRNRLPFGKRQSA